MKSGTLERCSLHVWIPVSLYWAEGRQRVWRHVGERFADVNVVDRVAHGGGGVMLWAGVCYGQGTQGHFIDGILNAQRYRDEILRPIVVPFIHEHHLILQHANARLHVARICTQFLVAENIPSTTWSTLWRRCVALREANGGHARYRLVFGPPQYSKTAQKQKCWVYNFVQCIFKCEPVDLQKANAL